MSNLPAFHTRATQDAADRTRGAVGKRDQAACFLDALDELLSDDSDTPKFLAAE